MDTLIETAKRPISITVICIIMFIVGVIALIWTFSPNTFQINKEYPLYWFSGTSTVIQIVSIAGLWRMKKWAAITYISIQIINQAVFLTFGNWYALQALMPLVVIFFALKHFSRMT